MSKFVLLLGFLFISQASCFTFMVADASDPAHPNKCVYNDTIIDVGDSAPMKEFCGQLSCYQDLSISGITCGIEHAGKGCKLVPGDTTKHYPDCCDKIKC